MSDLLNSVLVLGLQLKNTKKDTSRPLEFSEGSHIMSHFEGYYFIFLFTPFCPKWDKVHLVLFPQPHVDRLFPSLVIKSDLPPSLFRKPEKKSGKRRLIHR